MQASRGMPVRSHQHTNTPTHLHTIPPSHQPTNPPTGPTKKGERMISTIVVGAVSYIGVKIYLKGKKRKKLITVLVDASPTDEQKSSFQAFIPQKMGPFLSETHRQQMQEVSAGKQEISQTEKKMDRALVIASANMGVAAISWFYPPLVLITIPGLIYGTIPLYQLAYKDMKEGRLSSYVVDAIGTTGMAMGGFFRTIVLGTWIFTIGRNLLLKSEDNSKKNLMNLFVEQPRSVWVLVDDVEVEIPFEKLQAGDIIIISAGQSIPVDGPITDGFASVDQHTLTGESKPVEKRVGDAVLASTVVLAGRIYVETQKTGDETVAMQIGEVLKQTADFKSLMQSRGEVIADQTVLPTLGMSVFVWPFLGFSATLAVLTNTFGYKMRAFAPASMLTFLNIASQQGILIKDGRSLDLLKQVDTVVFDKTGTLTREEPTVDRIHTCANVHEDDILRYAAAAEYRQTHPIAKAILTAANKRKLHWPKLDDARYEVGYGIQVNLSARVVRVGSERFMAIEGINIPPEISAIQEVCHSQGHSLVMVAFDEELVGAIELRATLRPETKRVISSLRQRQMSIYIISGDHEQPTKKLAQALGVEHYFANTLPENKAALIAKLQKEGKSICFVGDGINDSIALKKANVSVSLRGATTMAMDTAQIVLMDGSLNQLDQLFDIAQNFEVNMRNNLLISTIPSVICIGGILFFHWGVTIGMALTGTTLLIGIGNTMLPLLSSQNTKSIG